MEKAEPVRRMAERLETRMLIVVSHADPAIGAQYKVQLEEIRRELGAGFDPLETLLIERVALCWMRLTFVEDQAVCKYLPGTTQESCEFWDRRLDHAHSRFLKACLALERVRKLRQRRPVSAAAIEAVLGDSITRGLSASRGLEIAGRMLAKRKAE
jgi:hypothetical protein